MTTLSRENASVSSSSNPAAALDRHASQEKHISLTFVDDDDDYREAACLELEMLGFEVFAMPDGNAMLSYFEQGNRADVIVLDWHLPSGPGVNLLPQLRRCGVQVPVIFLTGAPTVPHESVALERGALDFVDKARGIPILAKRIRLIVDAARRLFELPREESVACGRLLMKPRTSRAYWGEQDLNLTVTEFNIVYLLASRPGEYVTYRAIYDCVHRAGFIAGSGDDGYRTNVRSSVKRIRNKFHQIDAEFSEIENFPAFGYRWRSAPSSLD